MGHSVFSAGEFAEHSRKTVSVIDDDEEMCLFIRDLLDRCTDLKYLDAYCSAEQALEVLPQRVPELALVDLRLPGLSGIECIHRLRALLPSLQIVVFTGARGSAIIEEASLAGCDAYLEKPFSTHQLLATLRFCLSQPGRQTTSEQRSRAPDFQEQTGLQLDFTSREQEVMMRLAQGLLYKEIASEMGLSFSLVHKLQNRVFHKLRARNRTEALNKWRQINSRHSTTAEPRP